MYEALLVLAPSIYLIGLSFNQRIIPIPCNLDLTSVVLANISIDYDDILLTRVIAEIWATGQKTVKVEPGNQFVNCDEC